MVTCSRSQSICQRQNQDWDRRPLTPTRTLELSLPQPFCVQAAMSSHGAFLGSLLISSACYYRRAAAHPALSFEAPAPQIPIQESPQHLPPPAGDSDKQDRAPLGWRGASESPCDHSMRNHKGLESLISHLKLSSSPGSPALILRLTRP